MLNTIEDLVLFVCDPINGFDPKLLEPRDRSIMYSISSQLKRNLSLTNKQADLVIKILQDNYQLYKSITNLNFLLDNPNYKYPFRVIDVSRKIMLDEKSKEIRVKFPFDPIVNKQLDKVPVRRNYDILNRCHVFRVTETSILSLVDSLKDHNFEIDGKLLEWYREIQTILSDPDKFLPTADIVDNTVVVKNLNNNSLSYFEQNRKNDLIADTLLAKMMGFNISINLKGVIANQQIDNLTKVIITEKTPKFAISSESPYDKFNVANFIREAKAYPTLILLNDDDKLATTFKQWIIALNKNSIENTEISVLFRSDHHNEFNMMIKEEHLNNLVDKNTKIVFVKNKIPKILYKLDFKPMLVISSNTFYVHYTGQKLIDSHPLVVYYTEQAIGRTNSKFAKL